MREEFDNKSESRDKTNKFWINGSFQESFPSDPIIRYIRTYNYFQTHIENKRFQTKLFIFWDSNMKEQNLSNDYDEIKEVFIAQRQFSDHL